MGRKALPAAGTRPLTHAGVPIDDGTGGLGRRNIMIKTAFGGIPKYECWHPRKQPGLAMLYFISFALLAAFILFSLFIGAAAGGMNDAYDEFNEEQAVLRAEAITKSADDDDPQ